MKNLPRTHLAQRCSEHAQELHLPSDPGHVRRGIAARRPHVAQGLLSADRSRARRKAVRRVAAGPTHAANGIKQCREAPKIEHGVPDRPYAKRLHKRLVQAGDATIAQCIARAHRSLAAQRQQRIVRNPQRAHAVACAAEQGNGVSLAANSPKAACARGRLLHPDQDRRAGRACPRSSRRSERQRERQGEHRIPPRKACPPIALSRAPKAQKRPNRLLGGTGRAHQMEGSDAQRLHRDAPADPGALRRTGADILHAACR